MKDLSTWFSGKSSRFSMLLSNIGPINKLRLFINTNRYTRLLRLDNNIGTYLMLMPILWALTFASKSLSQILVYFILFIIGAFIMRSAGCIINDMADQELDKKVERTSSRPLASGEVSLREAGCLVGILLLIAMSLLFYLPSVVAYIALLAIPLIIIYPFTKRVMNYPQIFLGLTFNLGVLMAWFTVSPQPSFSPFLLYIAAVLWTFAYDTIYAHQDSKDDLEAGIKSSAIAIGKRTKQVVWRVYQLLIALIIPNNVWCVISVILAG
jgi:4-hydroxybenzoate polyprenyltransferase